MKLREAIRTGQPPSRRAWGAAILALCALYALGLNNQWAISPDGALYLTLGRSLAEGRGMEFNGVHWWSLPPILPLLIAACRTVAGDGYWLINLVLSACAVGAAVAAARIVRRLGAADLALPVLLATGLSAYLFITATRIQTDVLFTLLAALGLYGFVRGAAGSPWWVIFGGAAMLLATLTRLQGGLFLAGGLAGLALSLRRTRGVRRIAALAAVVAVAAAVLWYWTAYVRTQADVGAGDYTVVLSEHAETFFSLHRLENIGAGLALLPSSVFAAIFGQPLSSWLMLGPLLIVLLGLATLARRGQWIIVLPVVLNIGLLILLGGSAVARRYILPVMPYLVYALLVGTQVAVAWIRRRQPAGGAAAGRVAAIVVAAACVGISLPKIAREIYWMRSPDFYAAYDRGTWQSIVQASQYLREHGRAEIDVVMGPDHSVVHYLSRLRIFTQVLEPGLGTWKPATIPPELFVKTAVASPARFVLIPTDAPDWSEEAAAKFAASGAFEPPVLIGVTPAKPTGALAIYTRRTAPAGVTR
ncbi:MAG: glycosyltransferase family 39 protein [Planctomycetota bacterium]|nr:glycosyltransferase family 39 protein [Planctomycetota bacterium]